MASECHGRAIEPGASIEGWEAGGRGQRRKNPPQKTNTQCLWGTTGLQALLPLLLGHLSSFSGSLGCPCGLQWTLPRGGQRRQETEHPLDLWTLWLPPGLEGPSLPRGSRCLVNTGSSVEKQDSSCSSRLDLLARPPGGPRASCSHAQTRQGRGVMGCWVSPPDSCVGAPTSGT